MLRIIIAAIIGFVIWSILWVGSDAVLMAISPWYKESSEGFQKALETGASFNVPSTMLIISLIRSVIFSIIAGLITAIISKETLRGFNLNLIDGKHKIIEICSKSILKFDYDFTIKLQMK